MRARTLHLTLVASVALNLFLVGAIVGGALRLRGHGPLIMAGSLRFAGTELPENERRAFRTTLREARLSKRADVLASRAARIEAARLLEQPVPDQAAILTALDRSRTAEAAVRAAVEERAVALAAGLPAADRTRLSDALRHRVEKEQQAPGAP